MKDDFGPIMSDILVIAKVTNRGEAWSLESFCRSHSYLSTVKNSRCGISF